MTSTVTGALARLVLGWAFAAAALGWVLALQPTSSGAVSILGIRLTRADLPALPLLVAGLALSVLAVVGRRARAATLATLLLSAFGVMAWAVICWLVSDAADEVSLLAPVTPVSFGIRESDVTRTAAAILAAVCAIFGVVQFVRSATAYPGEGRDDNEPLQGFFRAEL